MLLKFTALPPARAPRGSQSAPCLMPDDQFAGLVPSWEAEAGIVWVVAFKSGAMVAVKESLEEIEDMLLRAMPENQREIIESLKAARVGVS